MQLHGRAARHAALLISAMASAASAPPASAAGPADVHVRVEGVARTLFDRVVRSEPRSIRAASDSRPRACDGTNLGTSSAPGPTATSATVDAMATIGQDFDGTWYPGYDDYFIARWGPEAEDDAKGWWWGALVNWSFTSIGGCQLQVGTGDEVLWVNDAFSGRRFLRLDGAATAVADAPYAARVRSSALTTAGGDATADPQPDAVVVGVDANGQPAPDAVVEGTSGLDGTAVVTFRALGWQRIKARMPDRDGDGREDAIASNSLDVCVVATPADRCLGQPPSQVPVRPGPPPSPAPDATPPHAPSPVPRPGPEPPLAGDGTPPSTRDDQPGPGPMRITSARILDAGKRHGRVTVAWRVDAPVAIARWTVSATPLGARPGRVAARAHGDGGTTRASLRPPAGRTYLLRLAVVDALGRSASRTIGRVLVPVDDRARGVGRRGAWRAVSHPTAWRGTLSRGARGAAMRVRLGAGRPVVLVRPGSRAARVELRSGGGRTVARIPAGARARQLRAPAQRRSGPVELRVRSGTMHVDGIGLAP